jgi:hypothetical protein
MPGAGQAPCALGRSEGRVEGQRALLLRQLARRFGSLPEAVMRYVQNADSEQLEYWGERLMSATVLDDVFMYRVMPLTRQEVLIGLIRRQPDLLAALLALVDPTLLPDVPGMALVPVSSLFAGMEYTDELPDLVLHCTVPGQDGPALALVVQVQLAQDAKAGALWALFMAGIELRDRCPVALVVITLDERTARWAVTPHRSGGSVELAPLVIGPAQIPRITELAQARSWPELAVLSAAAHGRAPGAEHVAHAAILGCAALAPLEHAFYVDFVVSCLGKRARRALEKIMPLAYFAQQSDAGKRIPADDLIHELRAAR